jgi:hypothetical protein
MLMLTMFVMTLGTIDVGLLPTCARIGSVAPLLLVTLGIAQGGTSGVSVQLIVPALITLTATLFVRESRHAPLDS